QSLASRSVRALQPSQQGPQLPAPACQLHTANPGEGHRPAWPRLTFEALSLFLSSSLSPLPQVCTHTHTHSHTQAYIKSFCMQGDNMTTYIRTPMNMQIQYTFVQLTPSVLVLYVSGV